MHLWELTRIGMVSGISSMIGTWELSLILITLGQLASFFFFLSFLSPSLPLTLPPSFFVSFFSFFKKQKLSLTVLHYRLVIHAYCKVEVRIVLKLQAQ